MGGGLHQSLQQHAAAQHVQPAPAQPQSMQHQQLGRGGTTPSSRAQSGGQGGSNYVAVSEMHNCDASCVSCVRPGVIP